MRTGYRMLLWAGCFFCAYFFFGKYQQEKKRGDAAEQEIDRQGLVIASQAFNINRFNQIALYTSQMNSLINDGTEKTVIEYREILRHEKNCDFLIPGDIAGGLLDYTHRLRSDAMHTAPGKFDGTGAGSAAAREITYCQAVLWIRPLLDALAMTNSQLAAIRLAEETRK